MKETFKRYPNTFHVLSFYQHTQIDIKAFSLPFVDTEILVIKYTGVS